MRSNDNGDIISQIRDGNYPGGYVPWTMSSGVSRLPLIPPALRGALRAAPFLSAERCLAYARLILGAVVLALAAVVATSHGGLDIFGKPLGTDFVSFWAASRLALVGHPAAVYDPAIHGAVEHGLFGQALAGYYAFFYPPIFLLLCLPLAALPYLASLALWLLATGAAYWWVVAAILGSPGLSVAILAYPAVFLDIGYGQNGMLSAALFGGVALALPRRSVLAGVLCGCLAYKPHLALALPVVLIAERRWTTLAAAGLTAAALALASFIVFGAATWSAFLAAGQTARSVMELGLAGFAKQVSVFAAARMLGLDVVPAYATQACLALLAAGVAATVVGRGAAGRGSGALAAAASLLMTPFALDYDLAIVAVPLAWLLAQGVRDGFLPWEKSVMAAAYLLPAFARPMEAHASLPLAPPILAAVFALVVRRIRTNAQIVASRQQES